MLTIVHHMSRVLNFPVDVIISITIYGDVIMGPISVSNHQPHDCLLNLLFRRRSKKISKIRVTGLCAVNSPGTGEFPHKWPVTRKMFPFDDVIMSKLWWTDLTCY